MNESPESIAGVADIDCTEMRALVTGSTSGIGRATALALGRLGADVFVHGRDAEAGREVVADLSGLGVDASFIAADFASVEAVQDLAATVRDRSDGLDLLVNNAGGLFREGRLTDLGVEGTFHVNHLAPFLLTTTLLDHLRADGRVVTTASAAHRGIGLDLERVEHVDSHSSRWAYGHSKLANVLFARELARRLDAAGHEVTSNSLHPGAIPGSDFSRFLPGPLPSVARLFDAIPGVTSVSEGAAEVLFSGISPRVTGISGRHFADRDLATPSDVARDPDAARRLWEWSATRLGIDEPFATSVRGSSASEG
ncbi:MAG: SDR family NAD(P)-dependent oxidoreductase [Halobellus sp.]|uniref:SDR family NAD(P)-dependent oxidoreductase n=1 Tax=Halobellus sp. TaxID=1979212 RepID=UPI0035D51247